MGDLLGICVVHGDPRHLAAPKDGKLCARPREHICSLDVVGPRASLTDEIKVWLGFCPLAVLCHIGPPGV